MLNSASFENVFHNPKVPLLQRLQRLAQLQARVRRSGFIDVTREEISSRIDLMAVQMEARGKLLEAIQARPGSAADKVQTLLRLMAGGMLTEGVLATRARTLILGYVSQARLSHRLHDAPRPGLAKSRTAKRRWPI